MSRVPFVHSYTSMADVWLLPSWTAGPSGSQSGGERQDRAGDYTRELFFWLVAVSTILGPILLMCLAFAICKTCQSWRCRRSRVDLEDGRYLGMWEQVMLCGGCYSIMCHCRVGRVRYKDIAILDLDATRFCAQLHPQSLPEIGIDADNSGNRTTENGDVPASGSDSCPPPYADALIMPRPPFNCRNKRPSSSNSGGSHSCQPPAHAQQMTMSSVEGRVCDDIGQGSVAGLPSYGAAVGTVHVVVTGGGVQVPTRTLT